MWLSSYIDEYKKAKLGNIYTDEIKTAISEHNADSVAFDTWYQSLKTTRFCWLVVMILMCIIG